MQIIVRDNNIDQALKALKKKMQREGIFREMKLRGHYEKPSEKRARERAEAERARQLAEAAQSALFAPTKTAPESHAYRLRAGDLVRYAGQPCQIVRVNDCAAVVAVARPAREFTTLCGVRVRIQPKPALVRISPQSEIPILSR